MRQVKSPVGEFNRRDYLVDYNNPKSPIEGRPARASQYTPLPKEDQFKLPKPTDEAVLKRHESTGSGYFKQMMKGKKPIASISQYMTLKKHKHKKKAEAKGTGENQNGNNKKRQPPNKKKASL